MWRANKTCQKVMSNRLLSCITLLLRHTTGEKRMLQKCLPYHRIAMWMREVTLTFNGRLVCIHQ